MLNNLMLFAEDATGSGNWFSQYGLYIILAIFIVIMFLTTLIPNRKQKKERENLLNNIRTGVKIKTYGGLIGTIVSINNATNEIVIDVGANGEKTLITIVKDAIYNVVSDSTLPVQTPEEKAKAENVALTEDEVSVQLKAEEKAKAKEEKRTAKTSSTDESETVSDTETEKKEVTVKKAPVKKTAKKVSDTEKQTLKELEDEKKETESSKTI